MDMQTSRVAIIGFGEAGQAFATGCGATLLQRAGAYDIATDSGCTREAKFADYARIGIACCPTISDAVVDAGIILSLVTADSAVDVASDAAAHLSPDALFFDMNSVAPDTKRVNAAIITAAGGRYIDVAVMSPVLPARQNTPLLLSGPDAKAGQDALMALAFTNVRVVDGDVGRASSIKMIRSVMVKGLEALTTECAIAAEAAGVLDDVIASLNASWPGINWAEKANYNLDRMMVHGQRRAAEMDEVVKTLDSLGTGSMMTRGTVSRQRAIGLMNVKEPPHSLVDKIARVSG